MAVSEAGDFVFGIPSVQTAVIVDGELNEREWFFSAQFPVLHRVDNWGENESGIQLRMQYDTEYVYLAFKIARPAGFESPQIVPPEETLNFTEDRIRLVFCNKNGLIQEFIGNAASELKKPDGSQSDLQYQTKINSTGWQGELKLPYNIESEGELWFNFINEQETPTLLRSALAFQEANNENLWKLIPRGNASVLAFSPGKSEQVDRAAIWYRVINNLDTSTTFSGNFKVALQEETISEILTDSWQIVNEKEGASQSKKLLRYSCQENKFIVGEDKGKYIVSYVFRDQNDAIIAKGLVFFKNQFPISFNLTPYFLTRNIIEINSELKDTPPPNAILVMTVYESGNPDRLVMEKEVEVKGRQSFIEELDTTNWQENSTYHLNFKLIEGTALLAEDAMVFNRPENPVWHQNIFGKKQFIPKPFTPLRYEEGCISVWGRTISLGNNFLPSQIISQNQELLFAPMELSLEIDGVDVSFNDFSKEIIEESKERLALRYRHDNSSFALKVELTAEYDGYLWYDLGIEPKVPITITKAVLRIPLFAEQATFYNIYGQGPGTIPPTAHMSASEYSKGGATTDLMEFPFYPFIWLGNEARGLQFFSESDQHWKVSNTEQIYLIQNKGLYTDFLVHFVNQDKEIKSPICYSFGLMASPVKPIGKRDQYWSGTSIVWGGYGDDPSHFRSEESLEVFKERVLSPWLAEPNKSWELTATRYRDHKISLGNLYGWSPLFGAPFTEDDLFNEKFTLMVRETKKVVPEMKITAYTGWGINKGLSFWDSFGMEMTRKPWEASGWDTMLHCANSSFNDYFSYGVDYMLRYYGLDGVYLDSTGNVPLCNRTGHGCGYFDDEGILHGTYPIRATRELFKRIYKITHCGDDENGIIYLHTSGVPLPIISFTDLLLVAEPGVILWGKLKDIGLNEYRAEYLSDPFGVPTNICWHTFSPHLKLSPNHMEGFALVHGQTIRMEPKGMLHYANGYTNPGYEENKYPLRHIFNLMSEFTGGQEADFYPYWQNQEYLDTQNTDVLGSFYVNSKGEVLLVFCNLSETSQQINVIFQNFNDQLSQVRDPFLDSDILIQNGMFTLDLSSQGYRLLWIK